MVSIQYNQNLYNAIIGIVMLVIAILFILYMGDAMVDSTREFRNSYMCSDDILFQCDRQFPLGGAAIGRPDGGCVV